MSANSLPFMSYRDYVSELSMSHEIYQDLSTFFNDASPLVGTKLNHNLETDVPRVGEVTITDCIGDAFMTQRYLIDADNTDDDAGRCLADLDQRPPTTQIRIILISYWRDLFTGEYTGLNKDVLDRVGLKYRIHPEVFMWHFGSDYGLDHWWFPDATAPLPSALSSRTYFHLHIHRSLVSPYLYTLNGVTKADTVIVFSRNYRFQDDETLLLSRVNSLGSAMPSPSALQTPFSSDANTLFAGALKQLNADEVLQCDRNPIECILPFARIALIIDSALMDVWAQKVIDHKESNLETRYNEQISTVRELRLNRSALQSFTSKSSSAEWHLLLADYERSLQEFEQQLNVLTQKMGYRASMASLQESRISIKHTEKGLEHNARVKRLTQLAFIFIPLTFATSVFGMNLDILGSGSAKTWTVFPAIIVVYLSVGLFWIVLHYQNATVAWVAAKVKSRSLAKLIGHRRRTSLSRSSTS